MKQKKIRITDLLYPHWKALTLAFIAVVGESLTDLLEPWPLKIVWMHTIAASWEACVRTASGSDRIKA